PATMPSASASASSSVSRGTSRIDGATSGRPPNVSTRMAISRARRLSRTRTVRPLKLLIAQSRPDDDDSLRHLLSLASPPAVPALDGWLVPFVLSGQRRAARVSLTAIPDSTPGVGRSPSHLPRRYGSVDVARFLRRTTAVSSRLRRGHNRPRRGLPPRANREKSP